MLEMSDGRETTEVGERVRDDSGAWVDGERREESERELIWRRFQAGQVGTAGGQFTAPPGGRVAVPGTLYSWVYFYHTAGAPIDLRWLMDGLEINPDGKITEAGSVRIWLWEPGNDDNSLRLTGSVEDYANYESEDGVQEAYAGDLVIGWSFPEGFAATKPDRVASETKAVKATKARPDTKADPDPRPITKW